MPAVLPGDHRLFHASPHNWLDAAEQCVCNAASSFGDEIELLVRVLEARQIGAPYKPTARRQQPPRTPRYWPQLS
jgi:hypothetical protein